MGIYLEYGFVRCVVLALNSSNRGKLTGFFCSLCRRVREENVDLCVILLRMLELGSRKRSLSGVSIGVLLPLLLSHSHQVC